MRTRDPIANGMGGQRSMVAAISDPPSDAVSTHAALPPDARDAILAIALCGGLVPCGIVSRWCRADAAGSAVPGTSRAAGRLLRSMGPR
jgi:hypothetical protein